jgi:hypothetical protein
MYRTLGGIAAAVMLAAIAVPDTAAAQQQDPGIHKQVAGEEFSSQRRYYGRYYARRYWGPRYYGYWGPRYYRPSYYAYGYPYYYRPYYYPRPFIGIGPFGIWW